MEGGGSGSVALPLKKNNSESVLTRLQTKWGELEKGFQGWVCKQPLPVETAAVAATRGLQGAAMGLFYGTLAKSEVARQLFPFEIFGRTMLLKVRNLAILKGTNGAMVCALKRIRGKDDTEARALAAFTSGFMFQVFTHSPPHCGPDAMAVGLFFALCHGFAHEMQLKADSVQSPVLEDSCYTRTKCMLLNLGLQNYEKNFKKHLLTDITMPLLKDCDLEKAEIPLGPRVLILKHIERDPDLQKMRRN